MKVKLHVNGEARDVEASPRYAAAVGPSGSPRPHGHEVWVREAPRAIDVKVITEGEAPGGIGEPGVPPVAPAIANAWFALSRQRVRELPISRPASA